MGAWSLSRSGTPATAVGHVAANALDFTAAIVAHGDFAPGDPARAGGSGDLLVVHPRAVGKNAGLALLLDRQTEGGGEKVLARPAGERAEGVVGVGDRAAAIAANDDVALRLEEALAALLRLAHLPIAIRFLVDARFQIAQLRLHLADAGDEDADGAAGGAEQRRDPDREHLRIIVGLR